MERFERVEYGLLKKYINNMTSDWLKEFNFIYVCIRLLQTKFQ